MNTWRVLDASRSVGVIDQLLSPERRESFLANNRREQKSLADSYRNRQVKLVSYDEACQKPFKTEWDQAKIDRPEFTGVRVLDDFPLEDIRPFIDWSPFFSTWELRGKYPKILDDPEVGLTARELYDNASQLLDEII